MAQLFTTGPAHIFIGTPNLASPLVAQQAFYLGTCEQKPIISVQRHWKPAGNDIAGQTIGMDLSYQGQEGLITANLSRWNEAVYQVLAARLFGARTIANSAPGYDGPVDMGSLFIHELQFAHLFITFPKSVLTFYNGGGGGTGNGGPLPNGYHFFATTLVEKDTIQPGTDPLTRMLQFRAFRPLLATANGLAMPLYDYLVTNLPPID